MAGYTACEGSGKQAVNLKQYPSHQDGLGMTRAKTFGHCPACGRTVRSYGLVNGIKITRHKPREGEQ
jgi:hypothetical protein